jgi:hypothetical protein
MVAGVVSTPGEAVSTLGEEGLEVIMETMAAAVISVVAAATLVVAVVTTASAAGVATMLPVGLAMALAVVATATIDLTMVREGDLLKVLVVITLAMARGVVNRAMVLVSAGETATLCRVNPAARLARAFVETEKIRAMEEIRVGGTMGGVVPWQIRVGGRSQMVLLVEASTPFSCSRLLRRLWRP